MKVFYAFIMTTIAVAFILAALNPIHARADIGAWAGSVQAESGSSLRHMQQFVDRGLS